MSSDSEPDGIAAMENDDKASTSKPKSVSQAQTLAQPFQATDADFTLVSSDGASFKIHRYHLLAASTVIRELLDLENGHGATTPEPAMTFVDPVTETAGSLSIFLSLVYGTDISKPQHRFVVPCIAFLRKYDCQPALHSLRTLVRAQLVVADHSGMNPYRIFQAAAQLDDHITCSEAIRRGGHQHWNRKSECRGERGVHQFLPNRSIFDPATMGVKDMEVIPPTYFLALVRAVNMAQIMTKNADEGLVQGMWPIVAREFKKILELPRDESEQAQRKHQSPSARGVKGRGRGGRRGHLVF